MKNEKSIVIMNDVLETLVDSADGYAKAFDSADRDVLKQFFKSRSAARRRMVDLVSSEVIRLGGQPEDNGTILAKAHRMFLTISAAVQDNDEAAIEAVDDGEEYLREQVEEALDQEDLAATSRQLLLNIQNELMVDERLIDKFEDEVE